MIDFIAAVLSHSWSGLIIAAIVGGLGWLIARAALRWGRPRARFVGYGIYGFAALLTAGSFVAIVRIGYAERQYPPMGKLVDVGGYRMHILAEGQAAGRPTVVWIPGGHGPGILFYNFHKTMRSETRSILFDRPGTGWSDTGPFPRSTAREADELARLLENSGERGPFILIGHSYGGLLAANYARRYLDQTTAVILLDAPSPEELIHVSVSGTNLSTLVRVNQRQGLAKLFGINPDPAASKDPAVVRIMNLYKAELADVWARFEAFREEPVYAWANASIYGEFDADRLSHTAPDPMVHDGELGDVPVFVVIPQVGVARMYAGAVEDEAARKRLLKFMERMHTRYLATSTRAQLIHAPEGTGHMFPYEAPDFTLGIVRRALPERTPTRLEE